MFGATSTSTGGGGLFGTTTTQAGSLFSGFGGTATAASGTTVKFNPPSGQDTMMKGGLSPSINTKHMCICAMKEYENKCMEVRHC